MGLLPMQVSAADASSSYTLESVNPHHDHPQWSDLGMDQILAVSGQSNITPPSPVRLASQGRRLADGNHHSPDSSHNSVLHMGGHYRNVQCAVLFHTLWTKGSLYLIRCLRL